MLDKFVEKRVKTLKASDVTHLAKVTQSQPYDAYSAFTKAWSVDGSISHIQFEYCYTYAPT